jgi:hypothetical protein
LTSSPELGIAILPPPEPQSAELTASDVISPAGAMTLVTGTRMVSVDHRLGRRRRAVFVNTAQGGE